jgi:hypothetical protein
MNKRFLLYIDILGFAEMTRKEPRKVARIYSILDSLNVHGHDAFKTIVFSDTVLVYNPQLATNKEMCDYLVWYLIEFVEDLHKRLTGQDVYFRAALTTGDFSHYSLKNIECFFGEALVNAYLNEKKIPSIGLFIDNECNNHNEYFHTAPFNNNYHFVYLNRSIEYLNELTNDQYPFSSAHLEDQAPRIPWHIRFLKDIHKQMREHPDPSVRLKFLTAWDFHAKRYPSLLQLLEKNDFSVDAIAGRACWIKETKVMETDIKYFKRIGSGTKLSMQLTKRSRESSSKRSKKVSKNAKQSHALGQ